jgi:hypothetical protein
MPARVLYAGQEVKIVTNGATTKFLPVQSASIEETTPIEDILSMGRLGAVTRFQNTVATCKSDIKTYLAITGGSTQNCINAEFIQGLTGEALAGSLSVITVSPNGFTMSGILSSLSVDISNGSFAMCDMSFVGVGQPGFSAAPSTNVYAEPGTMPTSFTPVTSANVGGQATGGCANSFKFNLDLPNDTISCLGGSISGSQAVVASSFLQVAKPPFRASISIDGTAVDVPTGSQLTSQFTVGKLGITLPQAKVTSRSVNNAVGNVGATYSYNLEDVSALFANV